jgi:hypothetical protein
MDRFCRWCNGSAIPISRGVIRGQMANGTWRMYNSLAAFDRLTCAVGLAGLREQAVMSTVEERLSALESEVRAVKQQLASMRKPRAWLDEVTGSMDEWPEFEEVLRLGREFRESARDVLGTPGDGG